MNTLGLIVLESHADHGTTVARLDRALAERGIAPLARFDHAKAAHAAGLDLLPLLVVVFGDPKVGTPLMQQHPAMGLDLPLRIAIWQDGTQVLVGYNDPHWLAERHAIRGHDQTLTGMRALLSQLASDAAGQ
jgi:uncharacterized protein (DUF302 family)